MRRLVLASAVVLSAGFAAPSFAAQPLPVGVHQNPDGSVCVGISEQVPFCTPPIAVQGPSVPKAPVLPVNVTRRPDGSVCVTVSEQVPQCTPGTG